MERYEKWAEVSEHSDGDEAMNLMQGYNACVDFPSSALTEELFQLNPDAKVILR